MIRPNLLEDAQAALGPDAVRPSTGADVVEGMQPQIVIEPADAAAAAAALAWASGTKLAVVVRGGGTKLDWGPAPHRFDVLVATTKLNAVVAHRHGDLTATIQAGARLAAVNEVLARHGQWLPLDPADADRATIGGLVATNDSGPRRHRYGAPRDLIIGVEMARADGRLAKGGGIVVKNVAGYDLPRLLTGSFGSLGLIVAATFKLFPLAPASRTLVASVAEPGAAGELAAALAASQLTPTAVEIAGPPFEILVRFEAPEAAIAAQVAEAATLAHAAGASARVVSGEDEARLWEAHATRSRGGTGCVLKVNLLPSDLAPTLAWLNQTAPAGTWTIAGRAGLGVLYLRVDASAESQGRLVNALRERFPAGRGSVVVLRATPELKKMVDVWGPIGDAAPLMRGVKRQFDPGGVLNPGRGPGGLVMW